MKIKTRSLAVLSVIGLGLIIGAQITPGETTMASRPQGVTQPDIYFLIPTTASISISTLNGTASLIVSQIEGDLTDAPPIVNISIVQKDIVDFSVPTRAYYSVEFLGSNGTPVAITYSLTVRGNPLDAKFAGAILLAAGFVGVALLAATNQRKRRLAQSSTEVSAGSSK